MISVKMVNCIDYQHSLHITRVQTKNTHEYTMRYGRVEIFAVQYCKQMNIYTHCRPACIVGSTHLLPRGWEGRSLAIHAKCTMIKIVRYIVLRKYSCFIFSTYNRT